VYLSFKEALNYSVPRSADSIFAWAEKIDTAGLQPGDLVFFVTVGSKVSHVGIYTGEGRFIHSASEGPQTGVIYSYLDESYWKRTFKGAGRALPWDTETAQAMSSYHKIEDQKAESTGDSAFKIFDWFRSGFFKGFGASWTWGGFFEGDNLRASTWFLSLVR
jgi:probable lipoprotein NlpC